MQKVASSLLRLNVNEEEGSLHNQKSSWLIANC